MPSSSPTSSASTPTIARPRRLPPVLPVPRRAAGRRHRPPHQALEPRAGDRLHGRRPPASRGRARSARSSATARRSARRAATRSATSPGPAPAPRRRRRSGAKFDLKQFHEVLQGRRDAAHHPRAADRGADAGAGPRQARPALPPFRRPRASAARRLRSRRGCGRCVRSARRSDRGRARRGRDRGAPPRPPRLRASSRSISPGSRS